MCLKTFMEFFVEESCGQCTPCRIGNVKLLEGVEKLKKELLHLPYMNTLKELGKTMQVASKCGLGQSSPNSFLSILENFKEEIFIPARKRRNNGKVKINVRAPVSQQSHVK
jgi:[NiFe] hydrogenase diaphorase moiety large subunit